MKYRFSISLFRQKPKIYATLYFSLVPLFALIYTFLSCDFYFSTAKFEKLITLNKTAEIKGEIRKAIEKTYLMTHKKCVGKKKYGYIYKEEIDIYDFKYDGEQFSFRLWFPIYNFKYHDQHISDSVMSTGRVVDIAEYYGGYVSFPEPYYGSEQSFIRPLYLLPKDDTLNSRVLEIFQGPHNCLCLYTDNSINKALTEYAKTVLGSPSNFYDNYWRMFYFSTVTITTLGYGDIIPTTNKTRMLISTEAILGILLIGLFLNALSNKVK
jgi:hypothetical protein